MSDQRKRRQEIKQGLHQFLMELYFSYEENHSPEEARRKVASYLEEQYQIFADASIQQQQVKERLSRKIHELRENLSRTQDYDTQMYLEEKIEVLSEAIRILDFSMDSLS